MTQATLEAATGRKTSLFESDMASNHSHIAKVIEGGRVLAIGAAGSIGSETIKVLAQFRPRTLHVIDQNENGLAELVRQFRSAPQSIVPDDFRTLPIDYGSAAMHYFLDSEAPYDLVVNFAALKHVRSEKDSFSTLQMFDTNIAKQARLVRALADRSFAGRYFSVSTDKAANPSSLMGATKRVMEHVMFDDAVTSGFRGVITSARFANVAFSNGSLLQSFENRFARFEPIVCPQDVRRYFVGLGESGEICTLASTLLQHRTIGIPRLDPRDHLVPLEQIARAFIEEQGFEPKIYFDEMAARSSVTEDRRRGRWPLLLTRADTAGEKPYEEFVAEGERAVEVGLVAMQGVPYQPTSGDVSGALESIDALLANSASGAKLDKERLKAIIAELEPAFLSTHHDSQRNLDQRA